MLHEIFSSVFQTGSSAFELGPFLACTAVSLLLGLLIAWTHAHGSACSRSFLLTLVMLPAVVQTVIMLVNGSIGTGIAVAGGSSCTGASGASWTSGEGGASAGSMGSG